MLSLQSALSSLQASQTALDTISHNIANANRPGYSRQTVTFADRPPLNRLGILTGQGVEVLRINRIASAALDGAITDNLAQQNLTEIGAQLAKQLEARLAPSQGSLRDRLLSFFDAAQQLQTNASDSVQRTLLIRQASELAKEFNANSRSLSQMKLGAVQDAKQTVQQLNQQLQQLEAMRRQITLSEATGSTPNDLLDRHQQLVDEIAQSIDIRAVRTPTGFQYNVGGFSAQRADIALESQLDPDGRLQLTVQGSNFAIHPSGGRLAALQQFINHTAANHEQNLNDLATQFMQQIDQTHATGLNLSGPFRSLVGNRPVTGTDIPLAQAVRDFHVEPGDLYISITDQSSGERTLHRISIDPTTQSLEDIAATISTIDHLQALIDPQTSKLSLIAEPGYGFDFAGRLETQLDLSNVTGDAGISMGGRYTGAVNDVYQFEVLGSGLVGSADDLQIRVTNQAGMELGTYSIGSGYEPGSDLILPDGVTLNIQFGQLNDGDQFSTAVVHNADTGSILSALGLNSLFQGFDAGSMTVGTELLQDPSRLALSRDGTSGDGSNAGKLLAVRDQPMFGEQTIQQRLADVTTRLAAEIHELDRQQTTLESLHLRLMTERDSLSAVDVNEELVRMLQFQESFQASVRVIATVDQLMSDLMSIIR